MNSRRIEGRKILVTGGGSGIGEAACRLFSAEGATVAVLDSNLEKARQVATEIGGVAVAADVCDKNQVGFAFDAAAAQMGGIDGLVNAAGIAPSRPFSETTPEEFRHTLDVNLMGPFQVCHAALPYLQASLGATIVNIASISAMQPVVGRAAYSASKGGLVSLSKVLALELAPAIRVNVVCPGAVDTPMTRAALTTEEEVAAVRARHALMRIATPDAIASVLLFLTSAESDFMTGTTVTVDGGRVFY